MSQATDGINIATSGIENAKHLIGPASTYLDLGADNGNLIRSGNAVVVRVALWAHMRLGQDGNTATDLVLSEALADFPTFLGFARATTDQATRQVTSTGSILAEGPLGLAWRTGTPVKAVSSSNGGTFPVATNGTPVFLGSRYFTAPPFPGMTVTSSPAPAAEATATANTTPVAEGSSQAISFYLFEMLVSTASTLVVRVGLSRFTGTPEQIKAAMASVARTGSRSAPPELKDSYMNGLMGADAGALTMTLTFANNDAKAYLAQFPYFMIQYGDSANSLFLVHAHAFVA